MVYFNLTVYHGGRFGYDNGPLQYVDGDKTIIEEMDSDWWSIFEAYSELRRLGYEQCNIEALWYKDSALEDFEVDLNLFSNDEDALEMVRIAGLRDHVEMFVVHSIQDDKPFPEVGYIDVGPSNAEKEDQNGNVGTEEVNGNGGNAGGNAGEVQQEDGGRDEVDNVAGGEEQEEGGKTSLDSVEDSDDEEFIPFDLDVDSADDIQFTDSEEDYDDDGGFEELNDARVDKGKGVANVEFSDGEGYDSEEMEKDYEIGGGNDEQDGDSVRFPVYKAQKDMKEYGWEVGTVFASREEFKDAVTTFAVQTSRGITFGKIDLKRVRANCQNSCPFWLYATKMGEEST
ncbi:hypothetical protein PIB30_031866 [Stylosanthes scabra]|uniref:Transposase MuDR plant domain-containing protein n=1 Tax=Stylosanthes scabra TaxID=79078 RepID=A0ABU6VAT1_9FABA|nr:hypothetical protein [Stylosanthes scabra]